jgi:L-alanine-DL-glutamate epimerase-like enolase superfamily enzyme
MKITGVEAIYLRQTLVKEQCDSGQDALIVKVTIDAGITGIGEVDSSLAAVKGGGKQPPLLPGSHGPGENRCRAD